MPKMSSGSSIGAALAAVELDDVDFHWSSPPVSASAAGALLGRRLGRRFGAGCAGLLDTAPGVGSALAAAAFLTASRIFTKPPSVPGNRALDKNKTALHIHAEHGQIEGGDVVLAQVASHLLALEDLARVLALAGRAVRAVRYRDAVGGAQAAEVPALHRAGEALADGDAGYVHLLARHEVVGGELGAHVDQVVLGDAELDHVALGLDQRLGEVAALGLGGVLGLLGARAELEGDVAVLVLGALGGDLAALEAEHGHGHMGPRLVEEAGHAELLGDHAGSHRPAP